MSHSLPSQSAPLVDRDGYTLIPLRKEFILKVVKSAYLSNINNPPADKEPPTDNNPSADKEPIVPASKTTLSKTVLSLNKGV